MKKILFIGLGRMGYHMAGHLSQIEDFEVCVYNRSDKKVDNWLSQYNGKKHINDNKYDVIILCVGNDYDVISNIGIEGRFINNLKKDTMIIDHTTTSANLAKNISEELLQRGVRYLDSPVSGGEVGAINGKLSCMVGGDKDSFDNSNDILAAYCQNIVHIGESGAGQICKMANQLCIAGVLAGLSEAVCLVDKSGIDAESVYEAIKGGAAQSWQLDNRFQTMIKGEYSFGFAIEHMIKDLQYALDETTNQGWSPYVGEKVISKYRELLDMGKSGQDTSVLLEHYRKG